MASYIIMKIYSIIIPHFNGKEIISRCIKSIEKSSKKSNEIIVVDNASTDDSISYVEQKFPNVTIIKSSKNDWMNFYKLFLLYIQSFL